MLCQDNRAGIPARKRIPAAVFAFVISAGFALLPVPSTATTVAGHTAGSFATSPTGAATYTIPIWAPAGPKGMEPHVALSYNSQQGNGIVGVGWSISGLSSIYRCNLTFAQDAAPAPVALVTSDGYCMDGQRLRLTSGTYGVAGSTYQTEIANFVNVTAYGSAGNGPAYWTAQDRNGRTYTYGNGGSSQVLATGSSTAVAWMLNQVSDPPGNTMTVSYSTATGSAVPSVISWTPSSHGSGTYNYTMTFSYGTNVPQSSLYAYTAGTAVTNTNLLSSITIAYSGSTVKKYVLTYQGSPTTGRDELTQVQECSDSGATNCLLPTTITYQSGSAGVSTTATSAPNGVGVLYDFNGDGYPDLFYANGSTYYIAFGSASGYGAGVEPGHAERLLLAQRSSLRFLGSPQSEGVSVHLECAHDDVFVLDDQRLRCPQPPHAIPAPNQLDKQQPADDDVRVCGTHHHSDRSAIKCPGRRHGRERVASPNEGSDGLPGDTRLRFRRQQDQIDG